MTQRAPELDNLIKESISLHRKAWKNNDKYKDYLEQAIILLRPTYDTHPTDALIINNYAAVLLDLHRDKEALELLQKVTPEFSEHCENYAIALAKTHSDITLIRKWNQEARNFSKNEDAILTYIDYQAL